MVNVILFGSTKIAEDALWCKRYAPFVSDDRLPKARSQYGLAKDLISRLANSSSDTDAVHAKLAEFGVKTPRSDDWLLLTSRLVKEIGVFIYFEKKEPIPGKIEYSYGVGSCVETYNIFKEDTIFKMVETVQARKKFGLFKEEYKVQEKKMKTAAELFGDLFQREDCLLSVIGKEKNSQQQSVCGLRLRMNLRGSDMKTYFPEQIQNPWKNEACLVAEIAKACGGLEAFLNRVYGLIGYDSVPDMTLLIGKELENKPVKDFNKTANGERSIIDVTYA